MARVVDFTGVGDFTPLPIGDYTVTATKFEWKNNKDGDGEHCEFEYTVQDETAEDGETAVQGRKLFTNYSPKQKALWKVKSDGVALGLDPEMFVGQLDLDIIIPALIGRSGIASVGIEDYVRGDGTDAQRNNIIKIRAAEEPALAESVGSGSRRRSG